MESSVPPPTDVRRAVLLTFGLLAVAAFAAYRNTATAPFVLDDAHAITENPTIHRLWPLRAVLSPPGGAADASGRPVVNLSYALNYAISGEAGWSYHALSLVIHILAAATLFGVVRRTLGRPRLRDRFGGASLPLAAAVAGIWLLHPLQTAAVTYVSERTEALAGLFCLLTLYGFIRAEDSAGNLRPAAWRAVSWACCLLGMATKEVMVVAPLLVLAYDVTLGSGPGPGGPVAAWRRGRSYYAALASTWILLGILVAGTHGRGGTAGFGAGVSPLLYLQTQCHAIGVYLKLCVWPHPLVFDYGLGITTRFADVWPQALLLAGLFGGTVFALRRHPAVGFAGGWFFATLAPSSSILPIVSQTMGEHRMYLPLAAVVTLGVTGLYAWLGRRSLVVWPAVAAALGGLTYARNATYGSALTLWQDTVAKAPDNPRARYNLSIAYSDEGRFDEAIVQDAAGLQVAAGAEAAAQVPAAQNKFGYDLAQLGRWPEAAAHYEAALRLKPDYGLAHVNLARALVRLGRWPGAIRHFEAGLRLQAGDAAVEAELSDALMHEGRVAEAIGHCRAALRLAPAWPQGFNNLAYALLLSGATDGAIAAYREAVRLDPRYAAAWVGLGYALITAGRPGEAVAPCTTAVNLQPGFADAHNTLGIALAQTGRTAAATGCFEQALRLDNTKADVHNNLGNMFSAAGRSAEAIGQYREALRLDPDYPLARRNLAEELRRAASADRK